MPAVHGDRCAELVHAFWYFLEGLRCHMHASRVQDSQVLWLISQELSSRTFSFARSCIRSKACNQMLHAAACLSWVGTDHLSKQPSRSDMLVGQQGLRTVIVSNDTIEAQAAKAAAQNHELWTAFPDDHPLRTLALYDHCTKLQHAACAPQCCPTLQRKCCD